MTAPHIIDPAAAFVQFACGGGIEWPVDTAFVLVDWGAAPDP